MSKIAVIVIVSAVLLLASALWPRKPQPVGQAVPLPPAVEVRTVERVVIQPKIIYVYPDKVKDDLNLPGPVVADTAKKVTATGKLAAEDRPYTMSAVLDTETGLSEIHARPDPLPWLAPGKRTEAAAFLGYKDGDPALRIEARHELLRVKALRLGAVASADATATELDGFVGVGVWGSF